MKEMKNISINKIKYSLVVGSRSHRGDSLAKFLDFVGEHEFICRKFIKICMIAEGQADLYPRFGPTSEWDHGCAQAVLEQAGGTVINKNLDRLLYNKKKAF